MERSLKQVKKTKFINANFFNNQTYLKKWRITIFIVLFISFLIVTLISFFNNGYKFVIDQPEIILKKTLIKTFIGIICGFGLTTAGCAMQSVTRNDLASPTTLGFMPAASLGIMIYEIIQIPSIIFMIFMAFIFALFIFVINYLSLKFQNDYSKGYKMILIGVISGAFITTISSIITTFVPIINQTILPWIGTINTNISWNTFIYCAPLALTGILMILIKIKTLNIIENDKLLAKSLGVNYELTFWIVGIGSILISISSVIMIGSVTMIGIVIPHLIRMLFKTKNYKIIIPISGMVSSTIIVFALWINTLYTLGLNIFAAIIATPLFLYIIFRRKKNGN